MRKLLFLVLFCLVPFLGFAASQGPNYAGTGVNDTSAGSYSWNNPENITSSDDSYSVQSAYAATPRDYRASIVKSDGSIGSTNKYFDFSWGSSDQTIPYGGSSDLWGETWTAEDINDSDFGVVLGVKIYGESYLSYLLKATNFGFSIPTGSTINGIYVEIERKYVSATYAAAVDSIRITVYYTSGSSDSFSSRGIGRGISRGVGR